MEKLVTFVNSLVNSILDITDKFGIKPEIEINSDTPEEIEKEFNFIERVKKNEK